MLFNSSRKMQLAQNAIKNQNQKIQPIKSVPRISASIKSLAPQIIPIGNNVGVLYPGASKGIAPIKAEPVSAKPMDIDLEMMAAGDGQDPSPISPVEYDEYGNIKDVVIKNDDELKEQLAKEEEAKVVLSGESGQEANKNMFWYLVIGAGLVGVASYGFMRYRNKKVNT